MKWGEGRHHEYYFYFLGKEIQAERDQAPGHTANQQEIFNLLVLSPLICHMGSRGASVLNTSAPSHRWSTFVICPCTSIFFLPGIVSLSVH